MAAIADFGKFTTTLYQPDDLIEFRLFHHAEDLGAIQYFVKFSEASSLFSKLELANQKDGREVYAGVNPRIRRGGKKEDVALARCIFCDWDNVDVVQFAALLAVAKLPTPTLGIFSGHGLHAYWLLNTPIDDLELFEAIQAKLTTLAKSDPKIKDAPRVMRVPGLMNLGDPSKDETPVACEIIHTADVRYDYQDITGLVLKPTKPAPAQPRVADASDLRSHLSRRTKDYLATPSLNGSRNKDLFDAACDLYGNGLTEAQIHERLNPCGQRDGLDGDEIKTTIKSACGKPRSPVVTPDESTAGESGLPMIVVNGRQLPEMAADCIAAMSAQNDPPVIFTRGGLSAGIRAQDDGSLGIATLNEAGMAGRIARVARLYRLDKEGKAIAATPPQGVVRDIMALDLREHGNFPVLVAITKAPTIRPDGTIFDKPGYDRATRLYYAPAASLKIPPLSTSPTQEQLQNAVALVNECIGEFPYEGEADIANAWGTLLAPIVRPAITGKSPMALFDAPQAGTGKSLLADVIARIITGECAAMMGAPTDNSEWRKQLTATVLPGPDLIVIDNIAGVLDSPELARFLTANVWSDRVLGLSRQANVINNATVIGTGNNIETGGDMPRRCYRIRLDAKTARPWKGRDFKHPNLLQWVSDNRGRLVAALLTIARAWYAAGKPSASTPIIGSFESWSRTIGGILEFAGIHGFLGNLEEMYEQSDDGAGEWETFLRLWHERYGSETVTVAKIVDDLQKTDADALRNALPEGLGSFVVFQAGQITDRFTVKDAGKLKIRLGKQLRQRVGRRYGTPAVCLSRKVDSHANIAVWSVEIGGGAGVAGVSNPYAGSENCPNRHQPIDTDTPATPAPPQDEYEFWEREAIEKGEQ